MKKIFLIIVLFFLFSTNAFAFLTFKQSQDISDDTDHLRGITFKPDGTRMYVTTDDSPKANVIEYSLTTPFDIKTAVKVSTTPLDVSEGVVMDKPHAIEFKPDGKVMYIIRSESPLGGVEQFNLTTAWDTSTLSHDTRKVIQGDSECNASVQVRALAFKPDGTRMFTSQQGGYKVCSYDLTTPWDVSSATNLVRSNSFEDEEGQLRNIQFSSDGKIMYLGGNAGDDINKYTLATAWDITAISHVTTYSISSETGEIRGFKFTSNFTKLYVTGDDGSSSGDNVVYEYNIACAGTITCSEPKNDESLVSIMEAHVELTKRIIQHNTLPIMHRMEWLRRHRNKDNLTNQKLKVTIADEQLSKLNEIIKPKVKNNISNDDEEEWFKWNEGRISLGKIKASQSSLAKKVHSSGFAIGADKKKNKDSMYGYVFQLGTDNVNIGGGMSEIGLFTKAYSISMYGTKISDNSTFTDGLIGFGILDIDQNRLTFGNKIEGQRDGKQLFGSINLGKRFNTKKLNLNPSVKIDLGYTELEAFKEYINISNSLADQLYFHEQEIVTGLATIGILLDKTIELDEKIINHHGRFEYISDFSPSTDVELYYLNDESTKYKLTIGNKSEDNYRIGYGFDVTSLSGWSVIANFERFITIGNGYVNEIYLSAGYVPLDGTKFAFNLINNNNLKAGFDFAKNINGFDFKFDYENNLNRSNKNNSANFSLHKVY